MRPCQYAFTGRLQRIGGGEPSFKKLYAEERLKAEIAREAIEKRW